MLDSCNASVQTLTNDVQAIAYPVYHLVPV